MHSFNSVTLLKSTMQLHTSVCTSSLVGFISGYVSSGTSPLALHGFPVPSLTSMFNLSRYTGVCFSDFSVGLSTTLETLTAECWPLLEVFEVFVRNAAVPGISKVAGLLSAMFSPSSSDEWASVMSPVTASTILLYFFLSSSNSGFIWPGGSTGHGHPATSGRSVDAVPFFGVLGPVLELGSLIRELIPFLSCSYSSSIWLLTSALHTKSQNFSNWNWN